MNVVDLLITLTIGSYVWTTIVGGGLYKLIERKFDTLMNNHLSHISDDLQKLRPRKKSSR